MRSLAKYFYEIIKKDYTDWKENNSGKGIPGRLIFKEFDSKLVSEILNSLVDLKEFDLKTIGSSDGFIIAVENHEHYAEIDYKKHEFSELAHERNREGNYYCLMFIAEVKPTLEQVTGIDQSTAFELTELKKWIKIAKYQHDDHVAFLERYIDELAQFIFELTNPSWSNRPFIEIDKINAFIEEVIHSTIKDGLFYDALGKNCIHLGGINRLSEFSTLKGSNGSYRRIFRSTISRTLFKDIDWWRAIHRNKEIDIEEIKANISSIRESGPEFDKFCSAVEQYFDSYFLGDIEYTKKYRLELQTTFDCINPYSSVLQAKNTKPKFKLGEETRDFLADSDISFSEEEQKLLEALDSSKPKPEVNELRKFYFAFAKEISTNSKLDRAWLKEITTSKIVVCSDLVEGLLGVLSKSVFLNDIGDDIIELRLSKDRTKKSLIKKNWLALQYFYYEYKDLECFWARFGENYKVDLGRPFTRLFIDSLNTSEKKERDGKSANELCFRITRRSPSSDTPIDSWELKWVFNPYGFESSKYIDFVKLKDRKGYFHKHDLSLDPLFIKRSESTPTIRNVHMFLSISAGLKKGAVVKKIDNESDTFKNTLNELHAHNYVSAQELSQVNELFQSFQTQWKDSIENILDNPICADVSKLGGAFGLLINKILELNLIQEKSNELLYELLSAHSINVTENSNYCIYLPWSPFSLLMQSKRNSMLRALAQQYREKTLAVGNKSDGILAKLFKELLTSYGKSFYLKKIKNSGYMDLTCTNSNSGYYEYGKLSSSKNAIKDSEIKSAISATAIKFLEIYPNKRHHLHILCIGLSSYEHLVAIYDELLTLTEIHEEQLSISVSITCDDRGALDAIYQTICEGFESSKIDSAITIKIVSNLDEMADGEVDIIYNFDPLFAHNKVAKSTPRYSLQDQGVNKLNWEYSASRKVPSDPISKKALFSMNNHVQDKTSALFHSTFMQIHGLNPENSFCREVSHSGLKDEITKGLSKCNWLVIYDYLLSKETLSACQNSNSQSNVNRRVLRYIQGEGSKRSLAIITDKETHYITKNLNSSIRNWNLVHPEKVEDLVDKVFTMSNSFSGDTLLRSVGNGNFSHDIVGTAGATFLLDNLFDDTEKVSPIFWVHLDDYMSWFKSSIEDDAFKSIGRKVNYISDLLGMYISVDAEGTTCVNIIISESKLTNGSEEQSIKSCKQIKSTVELLKSMLNSSSSIDFDYWMNKFYEFIVGHFQFIPKRFEFEDLISLDKSKLKIDVHGISVVFHYSNETQLTNAENVYDNEYLTQLKISSNDTKRIFRAMIEPDYKLGIFEQVHFTPLKLNRNNEMEKHNGNSVIDNLSPVFDDAPVAPTQSSFVSSNKLDFEDLVEEEETVVNNISELSNNLNRERSSNEQTSGSIHLVKSCIDFLETNSNVQHLDEIDISSIKADIRKIFHHVSLPSVFVDSTITPNSIVIKLQGDVNLSPTKVFKLKDNFLSVVGLSLRQVYPARGVLVLVFDRDKRETVYFGKLINSSLSIRQQTIENDFNNKVLLGQDEFSEDNVFFKLDGASPHALIGGQTKSGKSILMNNMIIDLLMTNSPENLRLRLFDPKQVEFAAYSRAPHLAHPVVLDKEQAVIRLQELEILMNKRYQNLMTQGVKDFEAYNRKFPLEKMSREVVFFDELADWILDNEFKAEAKDIIVRLSSKGRAAGIHLVLATQRPSADVVFPLLRANLDTKIALKVDREQNSEIILGESGAENLLGYGHGIVKSEGETHTIQVGFTESHIFDELIEKVIDYWS